MRFTALILPIVFGGASAGPCRPSNSLSSLEMTPTLSGLLSTETSLMISSATSALVESTDATTTAVPTTEITSMAESSTEVTAAATSTAAPPFQCPASSALQCCQNVGTQSSPIIGFLLGLLGIVVQDPNTLIGATCSPVTNAGSCSFTPVCCTDNSHGGLAAIGCTRLS
ncbi:hypothetical protein DER45DRAFT_260301 [Fusarium avenaceum]|nr:hypothetical protein DER45DRAFT_260301 [Fusarium avenaceum]